MKDHQEFCTTKYCYTYYKIETRIIKICRDQAFLASSIPLEFKDASERLVDKEGGGASSKQCPTSLP